MSYIDSDAKNDFRRVEIMNLNKGNVLFRSFERYKELESAAGVAFVVCQKRAPSWVWAHIA